jgi:FkbH-like protein
MEDNLEYPLNINFILRKKKLLKREFLNKDKFIQKNIVILGGSTTSEVVNILEIFLLKNGIKPNFYQSEYNKYYEDALFRTDELVKFNPDIVYIHTTNKNISAYPDIQDSENDIKILYENELKKFHSIWSALSKLGCPIIQNNFDYSTDRSLGNLDSSDIHGRTYFINKLNNAFSEYARENKNLHINDINFLSAYVGLKEWFDRSLWYQAKYAMSMKSIPELAFNISKIINSIFGLTKKCLVLDLDNTCWGGVIGEDGIDGIIIGNETPLAESFSSFQMYINELSGRGITLAVCSKNDFINAKEGFKHPESVLKFSDFAVFKANWIDKNFNILDIVKELNIGIDSVVFFDDNPAERELVSAQLTKIAVPNIGTNSEDFIEYIDKNGYFEPVTLIDDDINRSKYYEDNKKRTIDEASFKSYDDFLISLKMTASINVFSNLYIDRITQLTNKTNQFNLTTKRYNISEIQNISKSESFLKIYGKLSDKYGNNGLIAVIIGNIKSNKCHIDLFLMSCRILKRGMEFAMLDELVKQCRKKEINEIIGYYYKTAKNSIVSDLYKELGFVLVESQDMNSIWKLSIKKYKYKNKIIRVIDE